MHYTRHISTNLYVSFNCVTVYYTVMLHNNYVYYLQYLSVLALAVFAWWVEQAVTRGEWRCVSMECGGLWTIIYGTLEKPQWCANSLDTKTQVSEMHVWTIQYSIIAWLDVSWMHGCCPHPSTTNFEESITPTLQLRTLARAWDHSGEVIYAHWGGS